MKYLYLLVLLYGCCPSIEEERERINTFTQKCKQLADCMEVNYTVEQGCSRLTCILQNNKLNSVTYIHGSYDIELFSRYLDGEITICEMLKEKGTWSKPNKLREKKYKQCIDKYGNDDITRPFCWKQSFR